MDTPLTYLKKRANDDWLIGEDSHNFPKIATELYQEFRQQSHCHTPAKIIVAEHNPVKFLASFIAATAANCPIFVCNPNWVEAEWQQVFNLVQPDIILGQEAQAQASICTGVQKKFPMPHAITPMPHAPIMIPTGGSSGKIRFAIHTWKTLTASVQGLQNYFNLKQVNSFCVLPLYHVSGLMQFIRSFTTNGRLVILPFKSLEAGKRSNIKPAEFLISLVPTQLQRLLHQDPQWLSQFHTVLLGGAPAWTQLLEAARYHNIRLAPTYGMTETASQIATLKPEYFLRGNHGCGQVLPHAKVTIQSQNGTKLAAGKIGIVTIEANSLYLGYYGNFSGLKKPGFFQTDDLGYFNEEGYLTIVGRHSNKIITGGENVFPSEVEAAIQSTNLVIDVCVIGLPDRHWGQVVTAIYVPKYPKVSADILQIALEHKLSKFKRPKHWFPVETLPRNAQGKINYEQLKQIAIMWHLPHPTGAAIE